MRVLAAIALLVVGAATGIATIALHTIGWGLALATVATVVAAYALPPGWWSRLPFCLGWAVLVGWLSIPQPEGDYLVSEDLSGYAVLGLGLVLVVFGIATVPRPARAQTSAT